MVIFGAGFLGCRLAELALRSGAQVTGITRSIARASTLEDMGARAIVADLEGFGWHSGLQARFDYLVLCAGPGGQGLQGYERSCLGAMKSILQWARKGGTGEFLFTSSTSVYPQNAGEVVSEDDPAPGSTPGARILVETEALLAASNVWKRRFIFRLGGLYGPGRHLLLDRLRDSPPSSGEAEQKGILNLVRVEDAATAIAAAFGAEENLEGGIFNIVDNHPAPRAEVEQWIRGELEKRKLTRPSREAVSYRRRRGRHRVISNRKARERLKWAPRFQDFRSGFGDLMDRFE